MIYLNLSLRFTIFLLFLLFCVSFFKLYSHEFPNLDSLVNFSLDFPRLCLDFRSRILCFDFFHCPFLVSGATFLSLLKSSCVSVFSFLFPFPSLLSCFLCLPLLVRFPLLLDLISVALVLSRFRLVLCSSLSVVCLSPLPLLL